MQAVRGVAAAAAAAAAAPPRQHCAAPLRPQARPAPGNMRLRAIPDPSSSSGSSNGANDGEIVASTRQRRGTAPAAPPVPGGSLKQEAVQSNREVSDKLIDVFQQKKPAEWRKLIAYSKQWPVLAQGVLDRWVLPWQGCVGWACAVWQVLCGMGCINHIEAESTDGGAVPLGTSWPGQPLQV